MSALLIVITGEMAIGERVRFREIRRLVVGWWIMGWFYGLGFFYCDYVICYLSIQLYLFYGICQLKSHYTIHITANHNNKSAYHNDQSNKIKHPQSIKRRPFTIYLPE